MRIRSFRTLVLLGFLAGCEASSGWQTPSFPTSLDDVRSIRRASETGSSSTPEMRPGEAPRGVMTPAQQRMALESRLEQLEAMMTAQLEATGAGLGTPIGDGSETPATVALDPDAAARIEELAAAVAAVETRIEELPEPIAGEGPDLSGIDQRLVEQSAKLTDLELDLINVQDDLGVKFTELTQRIEPLSGGRAASGTPQALAADVSAGGSPLGGDTRGWPFWALVLGLPSALALAGGWMFSRTGRSRSATLVEHMERRIDDVDERQARLEERQREALPLGKRGAYLAGSGAVAALAKSSDPVDQEAAEFFTAAEAETQPVAAQEAEEFFTETAEPVVEVEPEARPETSFTLVPEPTPEPVERFERTREAFGVEPEAVPTPEEQWQAGAGEETLEARLARGIQERYFAENGAETEAGITSGSIDWDEATRAQAEERAAMEHLNTPISEPDSEAAATDPPWAPLTAENSSLEAEEAGWRDLAERGADEAARYADGALDDEEPEADADQGLI